MAQSSKSKKTLIVGFVACLIMPLFLSISEVNATVLGSALRKFEAYGLYRCMGDRFRSNFDQNEVADPNNDYTFKIIDSSKADISGAATLWKTDNDFLSLPAGHDLHDANSDKISCVHLMWNLLGTTNNEDPYNDSHSSATSFGQLLEQFGYTREAAASGSSAKCVKYKFLVAERDGITDLWGGFNKSGSLTYCEPSVKADGYIDVSGSNIPNVTLEEASGNRHIGWIDISDSSKIKYCFNNFGSGPMSIYNGGCDAGTISDDTITSVSRNQKWSTATSTLGQNIEKLISDYYDSNGFADAGYPTNKKCINTGDYYCAAYDGMEDASSGSGAVSTMYKYSLDTRSPFSALQKAYKNFFGDDNISANDAFAFTNSQKAALYVNYVLSYWASDAQACADTKSDSTSAASDLAIGDDRDTDNRLYHQTKLYKNDGSAQYCYVRPSAHNGNEVYGVKLTGSYSYPASIKSSFLDITKWLLDESPDSIDPSDITELRSNPSSGDGSVESNCQNSGGAGSLGWIVCSVLDWMSEATTNLYNSTVKPALEVKASYLNDSSTRNAWSTFRDIANIVFVVIVLIVIFSQLTGVGIDNYGIKKILPKLIVAAVLINLSYLICVLCVDVSNILGNGLQGFLDGLTTISGNSIDVLGGPTGDVSGSINTSNIAADIGIVSVGLISIVFAAYAIYSNPALLLTLFISAIGVLISVLFLFILLAGREALIILLTVISPVAFILYMLPNTKKFFDKWLKLWEAMLFLYPICGLLIGGGNFASTLILNTGRDGGAAIVFTALVIGILPIFFIPTMLKGAFAAMGSIGNTISGFGNRLRSGATGRLRNSERYKNAQERSAERQKHKAAQRRAGVYIDKDGNVKQSRRPSARLRRKVAGTWVGGKLGMDANMGKNTKAFLQQEAARRGNSESMDLDSANAVFAGVQAKEAKQRIEDQETLITNGKARLKNGNAVNASSADSVALYHQEMLAEAHRAKTSGDNAGYAAAMDRAKAAQNILSKTDSGRGHVQANLEGAISARQTSGLSEAAGHLLDNYGDKYKTANRGAHALISDLAVANTDTQGNLTVTEKSSSGTPKAVKLADKVANKTYDTKGTDKYTAETLAGADESALERLENSFTGKAGAPTMSAAQKDEIAKTAYEALNNPNIHVKPEVENRLRTLSAGYTPPTSPEDAHRTRLEAQNQEIIDQQRSVAQTNHQIFAQRQGKNPVTGTYPVPNGYTADPSRPGIYTDGKGSTYNSTNNTFS